MDVTRVLLNHYLFKDLSPAEVDAIASLAAVRTLAPGDYVFRIGDRADEIWVVASGQVREYSIDRAGNDYVSEMFTAGAVFGEPGAFAVERTRVVNEVAVTSVEAIRIGRDDLVRFLLKHPPALMRLLEGLASDARVAVRDMQMAAYSPVAVRIFEKLLQLAETHGVVDEDGVVAVDLQITQRELAAMVGCTRENVNRALSILSEQRTIRLVRRRIWILNRHALEAAAGRAEENLYRRNRRIGD